MRYFIEISYLGTNYHGWQSQPNAITIQEISENCLSKILDTPIKLVAAGRTDKGVHANQMFAHFDIRTKISEKDTIVTIQGQKLKQDTGLAESGRYL